MIGEGRTHGQGKLDEGARGITETEWRRRQLHNLALDLHWAADTIDSLLPIMEWDEEAMSIFNRVRHIKASLAYLDTSWRSFP